MWKHLPSETRSLQILSQREFVKAEEILWQQAQAQEYPKEVQLWREGQSVVKGSPIPVVSMSRREEVLRVGGRIEQAPLISYEAKHPVVLPGSNRIT